jgi:tRNA pseudouridine38-40 synthase
MARFFLTLSYNGARFNGWQVQHNTPNTVQQILEQKLSMLLREKITLTGCGRTDTGVNARNYVAHFDSVKTDLADGKTEWICKLNTVLPPEIAVQDVNKVASGAHARYDATQRVYQYYLSRQKDPFRDAFSWYIYGPLDFERMNLAAAMLLNTSDFTSFSKLNTQNKTNICSVTRAQWQKSRDHEWRFTICANRFLRGMVRAIVGTLVLVGRNKITLNEFRNIIEKKDRGSAGNNAPANALFLTGIRYPKNIYDC